MYDVILIYWRCRKIFCTMIGANSRSSAFFCMYVALKPLCHKHTENPSFSGRPHLLQKWQYLVTLHKHAAEGELPATWLYDKKKKMSSYILKNMFHFSGCIKVTWQHVTNSWAYCWNTSWVPFFWQIVLTTSAQKYTSEPIYAAPL